MFQNAYNQFGRARLAPVTTRTCQPGDNIAKTSPNYLEAEEKLTKKL